MRKNSKQKFYQKNLSCIYMVVLAIAATMAFYYPEQESSAAADTTVIPSEAIRLRILANSDSEEDQAVKRSVRDAVNKQINEWVEELTSIEEARQVISSRLPELEKIAQEELEKHGHSYSVAVTFGDVQFPTKLYGQYLYPAGVYEAVLITLGEGEGANWWCVLFPPLCFLDFSNSAAISEGVEENVDNPADAEQVEQYEDSQSAVEKSEAGETLEEENIPEKPPIRKVDEEPIVPASVYADEQEEEVEVKFLLKELVERLL